MIEKVFAQVQLLEPSIIEGQSTVTGINEYLARAFPIFLGLAAVLAVLMIAWGGLEYILSIVPGAKEEGKKRMKQAVWGLLLALSAWLILETINPQITKTQLDTPTNNTTVTPPTPPPNYDEFGSPG